MKAVYKSFSSFLLKAHNSLERRISENNGFRPRQLKYNTDASLPHIFHINGNFVIGGTSQLISDVIEQTSSEFYHQVIVPRQPQPLPYQPLPLKSFPLSDMAGLYSTLEKDSPALVHIHYWVRPKHKYFDFGIWYREIFKICEDLNLKVIQNIDVPTHPFHSSSVVHNVFVSNYVRDEFNDSDIPSSVIYPGSDLDHFSLTDQELPDTVGMVYRLDTDKLSGDVIDIFISAVKKKPSLTCYIIGGGYYLEQFKQRVQQEGLGKNILFTGFISYDELPSWYKKIGLIVAPVHDESFGQVTPFAMSMGRPVVGYDTGAMSELLGSKEFLVPCGNVERLSSLIIEMINDPQRRKQAGMANRKRANEYFSLQTMIQKYTELYHSIIKN